MPVDNRPDPRLHPSYTYDGDEMRANPLPVSGRETSDMSDFDREAELLGGLAQRAYNLRREQRAQELDRRLTWDELYDMFRSGKVSVKRATEWADTIVARGVRQR